MGDTWVWLICATTTSAGTSLRKDSMRVVLPEPISPVITTKPSVNQMVDSMYALARACCLDRYRNCGSGLSRNGNSLSLKGSRYMAWFRNRCYGMRTPTDKSLSRRRARASRRAAVGSTTVQWPTLRPGRARLP